MGVTVRPMQMSDVPEACALLNDIIAIGATTAHESAFTEAEFARAHLEGDDFICCHVALDGDGQVAGFQWVGTYADLPPTCANIATFARPDPVLRGVGTALFAATGAYLRTAGFDEINATIRADNVSGLGYYSKMGFMEHSVAQDVPLRDGTLVDRVSKRYSLR